MNTPLTAELLAALKKIDTCTVSNAIETFNMRLRNEGFMDSSIRCLTPSAEPLVGHAVTVRIRCSNPRKDGHPYIDRTDWWTWLQSIPAPRVVVIEDVDERRGLGSFIGEIHASILLALGCVGAITNGSAGDVPAVGKTTFQVFAATVAVSHAYSHIIEYGKPVTVGGMKVQSGELIHADANGVVSIPSQIATEIPHAAAKILEHERRLIELCRSPEFNLAKLSDAVKGIFH